MPLGHTWNILGYARLLWPSRVGQYSAGESSRMVGSSHPSDNATNLWFPPPVLLLFCFWDSYPRSGLLWSLPQANVGLHRLNPTPDSRLTHLLVYILFNIKLSLLVLLDLRH